MTLQKKLEIKLDSEKGGGYFLWKPFGVPFYNAEGIIIIECVFQRCR